MLLSNFFYCSAFQKKIITQFFKTGYTVWTLKHQCANFIYCLFLPMLPKKKTKREESAAAHLCSKVYSPYSTSTHKYMGCK
jgi:hypothetical protein